ncbi:MAG: type IV pili twitching motility protein PilT, partial [Patescibacteria group bacterium]
VFPPYQQSQVRAQLALTLRGVISQQLLPKVGGGRVAAREVLVNNSAVANLIRENKVPQIRNVLQTSSSEGMTTLIQDLGRLLKAGLVERDIAEQYLVGSEKIDVENAPPPKKKLFGK